MYTHRTHLLVYKYLIMLVLPSIYKEKKHNCWYSVMSVTFILQLFPFHICFNVARICRSVKRI